MGGKQKHYRSGSAQAVPACPGGGWKQGKAFGSEVLGGTVGSVQRGEKLSDWAEFVFGGQHCGGIFIVLPGPCLGGSFGINVGRAP